MFPQKHLRAAILTGLLIGTGSLLHGDSTHAVETTSPPQIDGVIDSAWNSATPVVLGHWGGSARTDVADCSAQFRALWNGAGLYLLIEVSDENLVRDSGGETWNDDCIELYVDGDHSRTPGTDGAHSGYDGDNDYQFRFMPGDQSLNGLFGAHADALDYALSVTGTGYVLEAKLDPILLGRAAPLVSGNEIGFDLQLVDDDDGGGSDTTLTWNDTGGRAWFDPSSFGTLILQPAPATPDRFTLGINCGGPAHTTADGRSFIAQDFANPRAYAQATGQQIEGTNEDLLFQTFETEWVKLIYAIPVPRGQYDVSLLFAEPSRNPGERRFDVFVAGQKVAEDLDIAAEAGGRARALEKHCRVTVAGNEIRIQVLRGPVGEPILSAIWIEQVREPADSLSPPVLLDRDAAVRAGTDLPLTAEGFAADFLDPQGDALSQISITATPAHGELRLEGAVLQRGDRLQATDLATLVYRPQAGYQGRDFFQWKATDGRQWSESSAVVRIYVHPFADRIEPLLEARWDTYTWPYYAAYPVVEGGLPSPDGQTRQGNACGPTAKSQLMWFWHYPRVVANGLSFSDRDGALHTLEQQSRPYNYFAMPADIAASASADVYGPLAQLMWDNNENSIDIWGNGALTTDPLIAYAGFSEQGHWIDLDEIGLDAWIEALKRELRLGHLLILTGESAPGAGHYWMVDGFDASNRMHLKLNYGSADGYYPADNLAGYYLGLQAWVGAVPAEIGRVVLRDLPAALGTGQTHRIAWDAPDAARLALYASIDDGWTWFVVEEALDAATGEADVILPNRAASKARLQLVDPDHPNRFSTSSPFALTGSPISAQGCYQMSIERCTSGALDLLCTGLIESHHYVVESAPDLTGPWTPVSTIPASAGRVWRGTADPGASDHRFFRLTVHPE